VTPTEFTTKIERKTAVIGIVGLGYVGLPLALTFAEAGFKVIGYDTSPWKTSDIRRATSYLSHIPSERIAKQRSRFFAYSDAHHMAHCDAILVCVPTPIGRNRQPLLVHITDAARCIGPFIQLDQLVVLESTVYPGTTHGIFRDTLLEHAPSLSRPNGQGFFLAYSPEREDPGNKQFTTHAIPKLVAGDNPIAAKLARSLYAAAFDSVIEVNTIETAEMAKILENTYRMVNVALINEMKVLCDAMDINVWKVIEAASTKPFGFHPFYPGPGLGGHCVPIDPYYLTWVAREHGLATRLIETAGAINDEMPLYVCGRVACALNERSKPVRGSRILIIGIAYKKNIDDTRDSPGLEIAKKLEREGANVFTHDPHVIGGWAARVIILNEETISPFDVVVIAADHDCVDYGVIANHAQAIVDTRNVMSRHPVLPRSQVYLA